jgi:hypothetical protein
MFDAVKPSCLNFLSLHKAGSITATVVGFSWMNEPRLSTAFFLLLLYQTSRQQWLQAPAYSGQELLMIAMNSWWQGSSISRYRCCDGGVTTESRSFLFVRSKWPSVLCTTNLDYLCHGFPITNYYVIIQWQLHQPNCNFPATNMILIIPGLDPVSLRVFICPYVTAQG